jgi:hypothetical protein
MDNLCALREFDGPSLGNDVGSASWPGGDPRVGVMEIQD